MMPTIHEVPRALMAPKFDLRLARSLADFSSRAYDPSPCTGRTGAWCVRLDDAVSSTTVLVEDIGDAIVLAFKGTKEIADWLTDIRCLLVPVRDGDAVRIHLGFRAAAQALIMQIKETLKGMDKPLIITGHSLGGALATLAAYLLADKFSIRAVYPIASPRVGNIAFASSYNKLLGDRTFRIVKQYDPVPHVPFPGLLLRYRHVGIEVYLPVAGGIELDRPFLKVLVMDAVAAVKAWRIFSAGDFWLVDDVAVEHGIADYIQALAKVSQ